MSEEKWLLFSGSNYYPYGGWEDFQGDFDSREQAKEWLNENFPDADSDWAHLVYKYKIVEEAFEEEGKAFGEIKKWDWELKE
jgi:hypothetical protein